MTEALLHVCRSCDLYTLSEVCPRCQKATRSPHPARYSPEDRYGAYRRALFADAARRSAMENP